VDTKKIDQLFAAYMSQDLGTAQTIFDSAFYTPEDRGGGHVLIDSLYEYIREESNKFPSYFSSYKNEPNEDELIKTIVFALDTVYYYADQIVDNRMNYAEDEYMQELMRYSDDDDYFDETERMFMPIDLLDTNMNLILEAKKLAEENEIQIFDEVINFLKFLKKNNSIEKVFGGNNWRDKPIEEVIYRLYDYHKKNRTAFYFKSCVCAAELCAYDCLPYFDKIQYNCSQISQENFDKYRTTFITSKKVIPEFDKLTFCKNLLEYYRTGIMPNNEGFIDYRTDYYEDLAVQPLKELGKIYNRRFNPDTFMTKQGNFVCNPDNFTLSGPHSFEKMKHVCIGDSIAIGVLLSSTREYESDKVYYLMHVFLKDVNNINGNYEIQLNIIPRGQLDSRLQLLRLDNWEIPQVHKNIGKKLRTTTHIHLYNKFDLLRGKENGNFDIAYNLENNKADFYTALEIFASVLKDCPFEDNKAVLKVNEKIKKLVEAYQVSKTV